MGLYDHLRREATALDLAASAAADARVGESSRRVADLEDRVARLTLICTALWDIVREKTGLTEDELAARVAVLDIRDGVADGKVTDAVRPCPQCQRPISPRHRRCLYCGFVLPVEGVFDTV